MSVTVQQLRGTTADNDGIFYDVGVLTADTEAKNLRLHDGAAPGGFRVGGTVIMERVTTGVTHTVSIKGSETQVIWSSATSGDKTTVLPEATAANDGCKIDVATTLGTGDNHAISPTAGTIQGTGSFFFTDSPRVNVSLISDGVNGDWIIR